MILGSVDLGPRSVRRKHFQETVAKIALIAMLFYQQPFQGGWLTVSPGFVPFCRKEKTHSRGASLMAVTIVQKDLVVALIWGYRRWRSARRDARLAGHSGGSPGAGTSGPAHRSRDLVLPTRSSRHQGRHCVVAN